MTDSRYALDRLGVGAPAALLLARVVAGLTMAYHGYQKFDGGISNFATLVDSLSFPFPTFLAWVVAILELIGGLAVAAGLFTRVSAALLTVEMLVTGIYIQIIDRDLGLVAPVDQPGTGAERDLLFAAVFLLIVVLGPGLWALDNALGIERHDTARASRPVAEGAS